MSNDSKGTEIISKVGKEEDVPRKEWVCSVCFEKSDYPFVLIPCGHSVGERCGVTLSTCPLCRAIITGKIPNYYIGAENGLEYFPNVVDSYESDNETVTVTSVEIRTTKIYGQKEQQSTDPPPTTLGLSNNGVSGVKLNRSREGKNSLCRDVCLSIHKDSNKNCIRWTCGLLCYFSINFLIIFGSSFGVYMSTRYSYPINTTCNILECNQTQISCTPSYPKTNDFCGQVYLFLQFIDQTSGDSYTNYVSTQIDNEADFCNVTTTIPCIYNGADENEIELSSADLDTTYIDSGDPLSQVLLWIFVGGTFGNFGMMVFGIAAFAFFRDHICGKNRGLRRRTV